MPQSRRQTRSELNPEAEWFGFRHVKPEDKAGLVGEVFASVAGRYDLMNDLMSGGLHRLWKNRLVSLMNPKAGDRILDVAGGTGDIALRCHNHTKGKAAITVCDINPAMLKEGQAKAIDHGVLSGINWITGNAESLPLPARSVDIYCIAFGLRNVTHIDRALQEAARVLKPGGRFYCLEFSPGVRRELKPLYDRYCLDILPWIGQFVAKDRDAYQYLAESIQKFPTQAILAKRMEQAGLSQVKWRNLTGGIAVIHSGWRL
jgi:demethylmenaquinone methyltransferase/2-methoxy-6-polyprenyl-1,4-benzoquinol methylase